MSIFTLMVINLISMGLEQTGSLAHNGSISNHLPGHWFTCLASMSYL